MRDRGIAARRGQQFSGIGESPDVVADLPGVHLEIKRVENLSLYPAMAQAKRDAKNGASPTVFHRRNGEEWLVIMRAEDWLALFKKAQGIVGLELLD